MKVSGFTIVRNALKYDYPVVEAITSVLPLCDEFIVGVGNSEDETHALISSIPSDKIKIVPSLWDESLREGGRVLAHETNKAFDAIASDSTWAFYIQADEVLHEKYIPAVKEAMTQWKEDPRVEGLLFNYLHFYGSYDYAGDSRRWYRKEVRVIRNDKRIRSYRDAQGFRKCEKKLHVKQVDACIYHYGWVKPPKLQQAKQHYFHSLWHNEAWIKKNVPQTATFNYADIDSLTLFKGTHPQVMQERIRNTSLPFSFDPSRKKFSLKDGLLYRIEKLTGWRPGEYRNYKLIAPRSKRTE